MSIAPDKPFVSCVDKRMLMNERIKKVMDTKLLAGIQSLEKATNFRCDSVMNTIKSMKTRNKAGVISNERYTDRNARSPEKTLSKPITNVFVARSAFEKYKEMDGLRMADCIGDRGSSFSKEFPSVITYADL